MVTDLFSRISKFDYKTKVDETHSIVDAILIVQNHYHCKHLLSRINRDHQNLDYDTNMTADIV